MCARKPGTSDETARKLRRSIVNGRLETGKPVLPIESTTVEQLVTAGITTVAALINWWKNNSFTAAAVAADSYMARLKQKQ